MSVEVGDLVCFEWHHAFLDSSKDLGKEHGTGHIPIGVVLEIDLDATSYNSRRESYISDPTAQIVWQRGTEGNRPYKTRIRVLRVLKV